MATEAQVNANRANARKSTGPRSPEGKETSAQNALKHGLFARETLARWKEEDREAKKARLFRSCPPPEPGPMTNTLAPGGAVVQTNPISGSPRSTGILPVNPNHGQDAHATIPPDGGTTNLAAAQGQMRETNPNSGSARRDGAWATRDEGANAQNKPNPGEAGWDTGQMRKTNPISRLRTADCGFRTARRRDALCRLPPRVWTGRLYKQTQFPTPPGGTRPGGCGTKGKCAKQTQFASGRRKGKSFVTKRLGVIWCRTCPEKQSQFSRCRRHGRSQAGQRWPAIDRR
jgi:hypothetical protein